MDDRRRRGHFRGDDLVGPLGWMRRSARERRDLDRVEVHPLGMLHYPPGITRVDHRNAREVVGGWWRRDRPLQRGAIPRIVRRGLATTQAEEQVDNEDQDREAEPHGADSRYLVQA